MSASSSQKRKADSISKDTRKPFKEIEKERERVREVHISIAIKIMPFSVTVPIRVGSSNQVFNLPKDLLVLHSGYFRDLFSNLGDEVDTKIELRGIPPNIFMIFASWLYTGNFNAVCRDDNTRAFSSWKAGEVLRAPAFQNVCLDCYREDCKGAGSFPGSDDVGAAYRICVKNSPLRRFMAHCLAHHGPLARHDEGSEMHTYWLNILRTTPDLTFDMAAVAGKDWKGTKPWDDENRHMYMMKEDSLEERWEQQILAARTPEEIKKDADEGCVWSEIELAHLERDKRQERP